MRDLKHAEWAVEVYFLHLRYIKLVEGSNLRMWIDKTTYFTEIATYISLETLQ